jgi:hypothetical protein
MWKLFRNTPQDLRVLRGPFQGARMFLNPANSKRKLFGLYEHCLNDWIATVAPTKDFAFDAGSNTGYDLYGLAYLISRKNSRSIEIIGFEPEAKSYPELLIPSSWADYSNCKIEIIEKFAGANESESTVTLDGCFSQRTSLKEKKGLIKIDVEGAEAEVLKGAGRLLENPNHDWLIEIHGKDLIPEVCHFFVELSRPFLVRSLEPVPFLGAEERAIDTYWLTTI